MFLIKDRIAEIAHKNKILYTLLYDKSLTEPPSLSNGDDMVTTYHHSTKYAVVASIAEASQTFLINSEQAQEFLRSIDRKLAPADHPLPFENICFQFTGMGVTGVMNDVSLSAIMISVSETNGTLFVVAWHKENESADLIVLPISGDGSIDILYEEDAQNEQRIANLALLILAYINTPNIETELITTPKSVNGKREKKGKKPLQDYYICRWNPPSHGGAGTATGTGSHHSIRYDVAGHFRRLPDGRTIWIRSHQRGLQNERYVPKVYRVE